MTATDILDELKTLGSPSVCKVLLKHGVGEPCYGVKIGDLQPLRKRVKMNYTLALELWESGVHDARYLAGLIADDTQMTLDDLQRWVETASGVLAGTTVPSVAAGSAHGFSLARRWIDSESERVAAAGWATWSGLVALKADADLDVAELQRLLERVQKSIPTAPNDVRYQMNGFVISVGCYVMALTDEALRVAEAIGPVEVDMGATACRVPSASEYIRKVQARGTLGKKRKTLKC